MKPGGLELRASERFQPFLILKISFLFIGVLNNDAYQKVCITIILNYMYNIVNSSQTIARQAGRQPGQILFTTS